MATAQITLQVDAETARQFQNASSDEKAKVGMLLRFLMETRKHSDMNSMLKLMNQIGAEARKNGLTEEILRDILNEKE